MPSDDAIELAQKLFDLARDGDTDHLAAYLDAGAPLDLRNENGDTFLILAAYRDNPATVRMLIERGADLEAENDRGQRALACAVFKQDVQSTQALVAAGADPDVGTPSARQTAQMFGATEILALLGG
ncbi:MAG TPA: ankyrin repeat domain-containing protein [Tessaracoccus flavescens]|uniref:Ankyrin repeat domain-containing protein n=1 Tax=Tessaracoccus flavescens TaxID=399497 RepID=A0A921JRJ7_9ACTN|nr:ankyrin repeat domain-containing protein [Tessaracoccus flavescens]